MRGPVSIQYLTCTVLCPLSRQDLQFQQVSILPSSLFPFATLIWLSLDPTAGRHYAEYSGYWQQTTFLSEVDPNAVTTFYDSVTGLPLFNAPIGRTFEVLHRAFHRPSFSLKSSLRIRSLS